MKKVFIAMGFVFLVGYQDSIAKEQHANRNTAEKDSIKIDSAIKKYTEAIKKNPNNAKAFYKRGNAYYDKGSFDKAIQDSLKKEQQARAYQEEQAENNKYYSQSCLPKKIYKSALVWGDSQIVIIKPHLQSWRYQYIKHPSVQGNYCKLTGEIHNRASMGISFYLRVKLYDYDQQPLAEERKYFSLTPRGEQIFSVDFEEIPHYEVGFIKIQK